MTGKSSYLFKCPVLNKRTQAYRKEKGKHGTVREQNISLEINCKITSSGLTTERL